MPTCSPKAFQTGSGNTWSDSLAGLASTFGHMGASKKVGGGGVPGVLDPDGPRTAQEAPKTAPRGPQDGPGGF
eukprot:1903919-Pyramimonas_sp.AAC.1